MSKKIKDHWEEVYQKNANEFSWSQSYPTTSLNFIHSFNLPTTANIIDIGASQQDDYRNAIEKAGMEVPYVRTNEAYGFITKSAKGASKDFGVKSVSLSVEKK